MCSRHNEYDEDLRFNIFYKKVQLQYGDLAEKASKEGWILCIPRCGTVKSDEIDTNLVLDHIIIPSYHQKDRFLTLSKKKVDLDNKNRELLVDDFGTNKSNNNNRVRILFEETFYIKNANKFSIWCLERPLFSSNLTCCDPQLNHPESYQDCLDYLWSIEDFGTIFQQEIHRICQDFIVKQYDFELRDLQTQQRLIFDIYEEIVNLILSKSIEILNKEDFHLALETYTQNYLSHFLIRAINTYTCHQDSQLNKILRNSNDLQLEHFREHFNIEIACYNSVNKAKSKLGKINDFGTILDKFNCVKLTFKSLFDSCTRTTTDDILQILVFFIIKLPVYNWYSNLAYLDHFSRKKSQEFSYYLTTFEAAFEFIKSDEFVKLRKRSLDNYLKTEQNAKFKSVISGDNLNGILLKPELCHPLCDCMKCTSKNRLNVSSNEKGQSILIFCTILSEIETVEYLLRKHPDLIDSRDATGKTALHYSCLSGNQKLLLILINAKAEINLQDNEGNTALMLAVDCGHTNCIKALIYTCERLDLNKRNFNGDTALHFAFKLSYIEIIKILLENNADVNLCNEKHEYPADLARSYYTFRLLQQFRGSDLKTNNLKTITHQKSEHKCTEHGAKPRNEDEYRKVELLLKSIEDNDLPLMCFYLGFSDSYESSDENAKPKCHPLCVCENCNDDDLSIIPLKKDAQIINVNVCNGDGYTPLHFAAKFGRTEISRILLDSCANPNVKSYKTLLTPLHLACIHRRTSIVKELVKCGGCDLNSRDFNDNTPIFYSCLKNDPKSVEVLLSNGADATLANRQGESAASRAKDKRLFAISKLIDDWTNSADISE